MKGIDNPQVAAIIPAAGASTRFEGQIRKQFLMLEEKPLLAYTLERVWKADIVRTVAVVVPAESQSDCHEIFKFLTPDNIALLVVAGGATRQASVAAGLAALPEDIDIVVVHDAVRPLCQIRWIRETVDLCNDYDGAIVAIPASDTLKEVAVDSTASEGSILTINSTVPRETIWRAQTPQTFRAEILRRAVQHARETNLSGTDDASLVEAIGGRIAIVTGSPYNIKVTTPEDWQYLKWRLKHG